MSITGIADALVVDDSEFIVEVMGDKLEDGYNISTRTASDGSEALSALDERRVDCVVSDYRMPSMDGLELYRRVDEAFGVPFILLTGEEDESVASRAIDAGVDDYIKKDTIIEEDQLQLLANRILNVVEQHRARRKYELLVDNTPDEIAEVTTDGELLAVNESMATAFDIDREQLPGTQLSDVLPPDVAAERLEHGRRAIVDGNAVTFEDAIDSRRFHNVVTPLSETTEGGSVQFLSQEITQ